MDRVWENSEEHDRISLDFLEQTVSRNMNVKGAADVGSEGSEKHGRENLHYLSKCLNCLK